MSKQEIVILFLSTLVTAGTLGYLFGFARGARSMFTLNVFKGQHPEGYSSWMDWARSDVKKGALIQSAATEDWK